MYVTHAPSTHSRTQSRTHAHSADQLRLEATRWRRCMSDLHAAPDAATPLPRRARTSPPEGTGLRGHMGTAALVFTVLACAAPLASASGVFPIVVSFAGSAAPLAYLIATGILLCFAVGLATMSRFVPNPG